MGRGGVGGGLLLKGQNGTIEKVHCLCLQHQSDSFLIALKLLLILPIIPSDYIMMGFPREDPLHLHGGEHQQVNRHHPRLFSVFCHTWSVFVAIYLLKNYYSTFRILDGPLFTLGCGKPEFDCVWYS